MRERVAGEYVRELTGGTPTKYHVLQVLTLRKDGTWTRTTRTRGSFGLRDGVPDSGTYRIQDVTINLRSLMEPSPIPTRYTMLGDTLFGANAATAYKFTGYDIGEEVFIRKR